MPQHHYRLSFICLMFIFALWQHPAYAAESHPPAFAVADNTPTERMIVSLVVNGKLVDNTLLALRRGDRFYVARGALISAKIIMGPQAQTIAGPGSDFVALDSLPGVRVHFDAAAQQIELEASAGGIAPQIIDIGSAPLVEKRSTGDGGFFNYDAVAQGGTSPAYFASIFEAGGSVYQGMLSSTALTRAAEGRFRATRLETSYVQQFPDSMTQIKLGDGVSRGGEWSDPYRFAGVQIATDFSIQPGFVSFPTPAFSGQSALPSTVDVFVNNSLRYRGTVDQGPFALNQIPTVTGGGNAQIVLTDPLGQQQSLSLPFYVSSSVLKKGLSDYSFQTGFLRSSFQLKSNNYATFATSGLYRYGLTNNLTIEGYSEATMDRQNSGFGLTTSFVGVGDLHSEAAIGRGGGGSGGLAGFGFSRTMQSWSIALTQRFLFQNFDATRIARSTLSSTEQRSQTTANVGFSVPHYGSFSLSVARQVFVGEHAALVGSVNSTVTLSDALFLNAYVLDARQNNNDVTIGLTLTFRLGSSYTGGSNTGSVETYRHGRTPAGVVDMQHSPDSQYGWQYGGSVARDGDDHINVQGNYGSLVGNFGAAVDHYGPAADIRVTASGGIALAGGQLFATRRVDDAFGLISVPGYPGVTVMQENRQVGKTDSNGNLFIPSLLSNYPNKISLLGGDVPIDADIDALETTVTPAYRGATRVVFNAIEKQSTTITLLDHDGQPVDTGLRITRERDGKLFWSGFDGAVYLYGQPEDIFTTDTAAGPCRFKVAASQLKAKHPTITCGTVK